MRPQPHVTITGIQVQASVYPSERSLAPGLQPGYTNGTGWKEKPGDGLPACEVEGCRSMATKYHYTTFRLSLQPPTCQESEGG